MKSSVLSARSALTFLKILVILIMVVRIVPVFVWSSRSEHLQKGRGGSAIPEAYHHVYRGTNACISQAAVEMWTVLVCVPKRRRVRGTRPFVGL